MNETPIIYVCKVSEDHSSLRIFPLHINHSHRKNGKYLLLMGGNHAPSGLVLVLFTIHYFLQGHVNEPRCMYEDDAIARNTAFLITMTENTM